MLFLVHPVELTGSGGGLLFFVVCIFHLIAVLQENVTAAATKLSEYVSNSSEFIKVP